MSDHHIFIFAEIELTVHFLLWNFVQAFWRFLFEILHLTELQIFQYILITYV